MSCKTDRDRLIKLLKETETNPEKTCPHYLEADCFKCPYDKGEDCDHEARKADYLLANGVIVPTFNCGDRVWFILKGLNEVCEATVIRIEYNYFTSPQEWLVIEYFSSIIGKHEYKSRIDLMLNKTVFLTKEEAEQKLKELERNVNEG